MKYILGGCCFSHLIFLEGMRRIYAHSVGVSGDSRFCGRREWNVFFCQRQKKHSHSRESGSLPVLLIVLGVRCRKTVRDSGRFPLSREWKGGREWEREGNGDEGRRGHSPMGLFADGSIRRWGYSPMGAFADKRKNVFLPKAKKHSHSRESGNLPVLLIVLGMRCRKTVRDSGRFPLSREWKGEGNGDEGGQGHSPMRAFADGGYLPMGAFADGAIRRWEHSPTNARMFFLPKAKKHSHSRESGNLPVLLTVLGLRCRKTVRDSGRFPLSREWGYIFLPSAKNIPPFPFLTSLFF